MVINRNCYTVEPLLKDPLAKGRCIPLARGQYTSHQNSISYVKHSELCPNKDNLSNIIYSEVPL